MMRRCRLSRVVSWTAVAVVCLTGAARFAGAADPPKPGGDAAEPAAGGLLKDFVAAFNAADANALAALFTDDAVIVDSEGTETRGRAAIAAMYAAAFQDVPGLTLESQVSEVRRLAPDVARSDGRSRISAGGDASQFNRFSTLLVRGDGKWRIAEVREYPAPAEEVSPYDRLKELEWMVGDWVDESGENKVHSSVKWADNKSFLIRTYSVELQGQKASSGTMFVGWDPQSGQIKSWLFDSNGGHGEALWTRVGPNQWVVKAQGVLHDGEPTSATQTHTLLTKDSVRTSSVDRVIGGRIAPDILDIVMVRKPPRPGGAASAGAGAKAPSAEAKPAK